MGGQIALAFREHLPSPMTDSYSKLLPWLVYTSCRKQSLTDQALVSRKWRHPMSLT